MDFTQLILEDYWLSDFGAYLLSWGVYTMGEGRDKNTSGNKSKRCPIREKVDLYEVYAYFILFEPLFILLRLH